MKYFVYRQDDYADLGGIGLEEFNNEEQAISYIEERIKLTKADIKNYTLILGTEIPLKVQQYAISIVKK